MIMETTEFFRVPDMEGYYISSNAPASGDFLQKQQVVNMCQEIKRAINYPDFDEKIMEIFKQEGL